MLKFADGKGLTNLYALSYLTVDTDRLYKWQQNNGMIPLHQNLAAALFISSRGNIPTKMSERKED